MQYEYLIGRAMCNLQIFVNITLTVTTVHSPAVIDVYCAQIVYGRATNIFSVSEHMVSAPDCTPAAPSSVSFV